jgi:hypothetical protein
MPLDYDAMAASYARHRRTHPRWKKIDLPPA